jgi:antitoxin (DNA-binding transcriptional repressor) of toxin-antitoxin stability system
MQINDMIDGAALACPPLVPISQQFPRPRVADIEAEAARQVAPLLASVRPGARIAITAGSRGITDIVPILRSVVRAVRQAGANPLVVATMGSHGGGTAEGQLKVLQGLGITAASVGAEVYAGTEVVTLGTTASGLTVYLDKAAAACDAILLVNRVKMHTLFTEPFGSGLQKMIVVGLGKVPSAEGMHRRGTGRIMASAIAEIAAVALASGKFLGGLAIVENGYDETAILEGMAPARIAERELALFEQARALMPRFPVGKLDLLIVEEMGKNISGTGMDVNITGRWRMPGVADPPFPGVKRLVVLRLTPQSEGNAMGIGQADVVPRSLFESINYQAMYLNVLTSTFVERAFIPMIMPTEREAIGAALKIAGVDPGQARVMRIHNTMHLDELWLSENLVPEAVATGRCKALGPAKPLEYDGDGKLKIIM